jgi:hypothetical protein
MTGIQSPVERAIALAAVTGLKVAMGPALFATARGRPEAPMLVAAALGEMVLDKLGILPSRYRLPLLLPRAAAGAWVAHESLKADGAEAPGAAALGAAVAAGTATLAPMVRLAGNRLFGIPDILLGLAEDYLALRLGSCAAGLDVERLPDVAREAIEDVRERVLPSDRPATAPAGLGANI